MVVFKAMTFKNLSVGTFSQNKKKSIFLTIIPPIFQAGRGNNNPKQVQMFVVTLNLHLQKFIMFN